MAALAVSALAATQAQATMVAGWDFSQWDGDNTLSVDFGSYQNTLPANYSNLVPAGAPTFGAGTGAAPFGTLHFNGQFGSTNANPDPNIGSTPFAPTATDVQSNINAPQFGNPAPPAPQFAIFESDTALTSNGQASYNILSMTPFNPLDVVFKADLTTAGLQGSDWNLTFGAKTFEGSSSIRIEFSTNGTDYVQAGSPLVITTTDTPYSVNLGSALGTMGFVRFNFEGFSGVNGQPIIDKVAINATLVPEPGTAILLGSGLVGLLVHGRRRN